MESPQHNNMTADERYAYINRRLQAYLKAQHIHAERDENGWNLDATAVTCHGEGWAITDALHRFVADADRQIGLLNKVKQVALDALKHKAEYDSGIFLIHQL